VGSILFVGSFILGASTLRDFALALFVGIAAGTYSSIFVAAPLLAIWKEREEEWQDRAEWVSRGTKSGRR
jgi:preprotein translocase subunit SecF